jgi:uncharacterized repeat protein (TIGR03943 family)
MLGWAAFVLYLYAAGLMPLFLWKVYGHAAAAGAAVLLGCFVCGWALRRQDLRAEARRAAAPTREAAPPTRHAAPPAPARPRRRPIWLYVRSLAFLVPIVIGLALPVRGLNDLAALQRGADDPAMVAELAAQRELQDARLEQGYAWTTVLGLAQRVRMAAPQKVGGMGFVLRTDRTPPGHFLLVRFMVTCCAADASPVAVPVRWAGADALKSNQWVKVYGVTDPKEGAIAADRVVETREPKDPYL